MESVSVIVAVAVIAATAAVALLAAREPPSHHDVADPGPRIAGDAAAVDEPPLAPARMPEPPVTTPAVSVPPVPAGWLPDPVPPAPEPAAPAIGVPASRPDPDRLIQTEVIVPGGRAARLAALLRLVFWLALSGALVGLALLGVGRAIASLLG